MPQEPPKSSHTFNLNTWMLPETNSFCITVRWNFDCIMRCMRQSLRLITTHVTVWSPVHLGGNVRFRVQSWTTGVHVHVCEDAPQMVWDARVWWCVHMCLVPHLSWIQTLDSRKSSIWYSAAEITSPRLIMITGLNEAQNKICEKYNVTFLLQSQKWASFHDTNEP